MVAGQGNEFIAVDKEDTIEVYCYISNQYKQ